MALYEIYMEDKMANRYYVVYTYNLLGRVGTSSIEIELDAPICDIKDVEEIQKYIASTNVYSAVVVTNWIKFETKTI